jgi:membrane protein
MPSVDEIRERAGEVAGDVGEKTQDVTERTLERLPGVPENVVRRILDTDLAIFASSLAFYALVSIAPTMLVAFWVTGQVIDPDRLREMGDRLADLLPAGTGVDRMFDNLAEVGGRLGIPAVIAALWTASRYGSGLLRSFDTLSEEPERSLAGVRGRLKTLVIVAALPVFVMGALLIASVAGGMADDGWLVQVLAWGAGLVGGFAATLVVLGVIYRLFGPLPIGMKSLAIGASVAAVAIALMSVGFAIWAGQGADFEEQVAGTGMAAVVLLCIWLYFANLFLLLGYFIASEHHGGDGHGARA